ncbi:cupredoxin domain-containing protein [Cryobacterium tepidiphilum]|uniref:EfeO-type cupredoxin-like domain-containing protein n=1 Tax=Cryobacterium tepidiphilum TaxID=2486026 RepID=A0A3M8LPN3_9MICO|nr:cupredoxin domain-containing protein [Cryobacterium tepidiphilum]RNE67450.1 hypothetical protein EEJ31_00055 [Cryobacterium tepidiphilum]
MSAPAQTPAASSAAPDTSAPSSDEATPSASADAAEPAMITIKNFAYDVPATVAPGATIMVTDADGTSHTITADDGKAFDLPVPGGGSATFTAPMKPGSYPFHCTYHANMHGVLVVK